MGNSVTVVFNLHVTAASELGLPSTEIMIRVWWGSEAILCHFHLEKKVYKKNMHLFRMETM